MTRNRSNTNYWSLHKPIRRGTGTLILTLLLGLAAFSAVGDVAATFSVESPELGFQPETITISTDKSSYVPGEIAIISGILSQDILTAGEVVVIRVFNPLEELASEALVNVTSSGTFEYKIVLVDLLGLSGDYRIVAVFAERYEGDTNFNISRSSDARCELSFCEYDLRINNSTHEIMYKMNGEIQNATVDAESNKLVIQALVYDTSTRLLVILPRDLIDAIRLDQSGQPIKSEFTVLINDEDAENQELGANMQSFDPTKQRALSISGLTYGQNKVEIVGTWVTPEFGALGFIMMIGIVACLTVLFKVQNR